MSPIFAALTLAANVVAAESALGSSLPAPAAAAPRRALKPDQAQARLVDLINQARAVAGLEALVFDPELSAAALGHSDSMRRENIVAHLSPTTGGPEERLMRSGIVTELFIRRIPPLGNDARALRAAEIVSSRELDGLPPLSEDAALSEMAGEAVRTFLDDPQLSQDDAMDLLRRRLERGPETGASATAVFVVGGSIKEGFERMEIDPGTWARVRRVGFGITQGTRPGLVPNSVVMVLIFAD